MNAFEFWRRWLLYLSLGVTAFGTYIALANDTALFAILFGAHIEVAFWPDTVPDEAAQGFRGWVYGAWGATVAGWGMILAFLAAYPFARRQRWSWWAIALSTGYWFVLDTGISLYFGVTFNALGVNLPLAILLGVPLAATYRDCINKENTDPMPPRDNEG